MENEGIMVDPVTGKTPRKPYKPFIDRVLQS